MRRSLFTAIPVLLLLLAAGCAKNEPLPVAAFAYSATNQFRAPCLVQFANQSSDTWSYEWWSGIDSCLVGIGPPATTLKEPIFSYTKPGKYTVTLRAYTESRKEWATAQQVITVIDSLR